MTETADFEAALDLVTEAVIAHRNRDQTAWDAAWLGLGDRTDNAAVLAGIHLAAALVTTPPVRVNDPYGDGSILIAASNAKVRWRREHGDYEGTGYPGDDSPPDPAS